MGNQLQELVSLMSLLTAVVQLNSALIQFYTGTTAYIRRRQGVTRTICVVT